MVERTKISGEKYVKKIVSPIDTTIGSSIKRTGQMSTEQLEGVKKLFHLAYYIASKGRPYTDFSGLIELEKLHGVKFSNDSYENESA